MINNERLQRVKEFFESGRSVCPFTKKYANQVSYVCVPDDTTLDKNPVLDFIADPTIMALTYVFESDKGTHQEEHSRAIEVFKKLYLSLFLTEHGQAAKEHLSQLEGELNKAFSPSSDINPFLSYNSQPLFSIAMNPLYDQNHPRWAPHPIIVITKHSDVEAVPKPVVDSIRGKMLERIGKLYDADELYITPS